jgi:ABC-type multidrug transport system fused ATPase/permease subunit
VQRQAFLNALPDFAGDRRSTALEAVGASADRMKDFDKPFDALPAHSREQLWRAFVWNFLDAHVSSNAAATYADRARATEVQQAVGGLGLLSLVVRTHGLAVSRVFGWLASWNPWAWRPDDNHAPCFWYLTGLFALALALAVIRAALVHLMNYSAAVAALGVSTWLRRALYHHTYRLGTLAIRATGPGEAVGLFTRRVEAIQDAVQARLTTQYFAPVQLGLLLAFALAIHFWLGAAFLLTAVMILLVGGQLATFFRRSARFAERVANARLAQLRESLLMMRLVKSNGMEAFNQSRVCAAPRATP